MNIQEKLANIGLNGKKAEVYLAILQLGKASVLQIAKKAGIKRPTAYNIIDNLIAEQLISQTVIGKKRIFVAEDPINLKQLIKKQEEQIDTILPELNSLFNISEKKPKIRYYEGKEGIVQIYEEILKMQNKEQLYIGSTKEMIEVMGQDYMEDWVKRRVKKGIVSHAIRIKSKETKIKEWGGGKQNLRELRFFPIEIKQDITNIIIFDNKVALISALAESYGLLIESQELAQTLRYIWKVVWQVSRK